MDKIHQLFFLENRTYLQSSTLFHYLLSLTNAKNNICFKFTHPIYSDCFTFSSQTENANALFQYEENGLTKQIGIFEAPISNNPQKKTFNEQEIIDNAQIKDKKITTFITNKNFFTNSIALIKNIHEQQLKKEETGRWIFSRADFTKLPENDKIKIQLVNTFPLLSCSNIIQYNSIIGKIYFSWVKKI